MTEHRKMVDDLGVVVEQGAPLTEQNIDAIAYALVELILARVEKQVDQRDQHTPTDNSGRPGPDHVDGGH